MVFPYVFAYTFMTVKNNEGFFLTFKSFTNTKISIRLRTTDHDSQSFLFLLYFLRYAYDVSSESVQF